MTPEQAQDIADRTFAAIEEAQAELAGGLFRNVKTRCDDDRERVQFDLAGLREHQECGVARGGLWVTTCIAQDCKDAERYAAGLLRTARLYGVELRGDDHA